MSVKQRTIQKAVTISGVGLHTGKQVNLTFRPAADNHGYKFQRVDLTDNPVIDADVDNVVDTSRGTTLEQNGARVSTTEHVLAALVGLEIDNVMMELDGPEMPIMDGSSLPFIKILETAGIVDQQAERIYFELTENLTYEDPVKKVEMLAVPQDEFRATVMVDYNSEVLGTQHASMNNVREFKSEIASCRTFVFLHELEALLAHNLIKGGDLNNAIVLVDRDISEEKIAHLKKLFKKEHVEVKGRGVLNNTVLHHFNEPARHKLLDIVGDLALVGVPLKMHVLAARPGHAGNIAFAKKIKELIKSKRGGPKKRNDHMYFDLNKEPVLNIFDIQKILPHRQPFLLIDKIMELTDKSVVGVKNVTMNEEFFKGHFPENPVMPGVLLIEAMAQAGGILVLKTVPDPENYLTYFMKIDGVKFKQKVIPGDTVVFDLHLVTPIRRGICHMKGIGYVNNRPVIEAEMMAQIVKVKNNEPALAHTS
ncbi:MAG: bifunctional UDP-3-O-[3-hydroxymyristoyl] N-acetylglucosamine deacetylase/3-hydroxyacyl-ACP dehydratase [Bacteroidota bacterium]|nr:bifunctional UDP-3-O-[3-hydroxymyristoyl] N-acetylglucosamine deacetylase/3-hydroxyacyl-ACP dehydratase [Bacteroidota bacterium]